MSDPAIIQEIMTTLGEELAACDMGGVLETIEGDGPVGQAVRNCNTVKSMRLVVAYLKDVARTVSKEDGPGVNKAKTCIEEAWGNIKDVVASDPELSAPSMSAHLFSASLAPSSTPEAPVVTAAVPAPAGVPPVPASPTANTPAVTQAAAKGGHGLLFWLGVAGAGYGIYRYVTRKKKPSSPARPESSAPVGE